MENLHSKVMFCGSSLKGQTLYNVPPSVENLRIDVEKCVNEHSEQMLSLLALLQDNRRGSVTEAGDDDGDDDNDDDDDEVNAADDHSDDDFEDEDDDEKERLKERCPTIKKERRRVSVTPLLPAWPRLTLVFSLVTLSIG